MQLQDLNTVLGVELRIINDQLFSCRFCLLSKRKNALTIQQSKAIEGTMAIILAALPKGYPVALAITGKGIIHKNLSQTEGIDLNQAFNSAFPSINSNDFYLQQYNQAAYTLMSISRKQTIDELLNQMHLASLTVLVLTLGGIGSALIWEQLNSYGSTHLFDGHFFELNQENELINYQFDAERKCQFPVKIGQEPIPEENVIAYAMAFQLMMHDRLNLICAEVPTINQRFLNHVVNSQMKKKALVFLFALFMALLVSFLMFSHYNQQNAQLLQTVGAHTTSEEQTALMSKNIATNETLLKQLNWNGGYNYGFLLNEIGKSMPKQLQLRTLTMNDFLSEQEKLERVPQLKITGTTNELMAVNNWIFMLKEKAWVKSVQLTSYQEDVEKDAYIFNLILTY